MFKPISLIRAFALVLAVLSGSARAAELNVVINQSPWLDGFRKTAEMYQKETGNKISLAIMPYSGMLEKIRNSVRGASGVYDIVLVDSHWLAELYAGGFLTPIQDIAPDFKLDDAVVDFDQTLYWDAKRALFRKDGGTLMGLPVTGNVQFLYYRKDLYASNNLKPPTTWDELRANTAALKGKAEYGFISSGQRDGVLFRAMPFLLSAGGGIFKNPRDGDYSIIFNSKESLEGLKYYIEMAKSSHPNPGSLTLADVLQLVSTGKAAQTAEVAAMWGPLNNTESSIVAGKLGVTPVPRKSGGRWVNSSGHWVGGIPKNMPPAQQKAAIEFLSWLLKKENQVRLFENGSVPVRSDLVGAAKDPQGVLPALSESIKSATLITPVKEGAQIYRMLGIHINQALIGERTPEAALNAGAQEVFELMKNAGYKTEKLKDL